MSQKARLDFYEIQKRQRQRSLVLFAGLIVFYFLSIGLIALAVFLSVGAFAVPNFLSGSFLTKLMLGVLAVASLIALFHYYDARRFGAAYILKRLDARKPDPADRYHLQFANTVEEMRIASGLPEVRPYVIPSFTVNSMARPWSKPTEYPPWPSQRASWPTARAMRSRRSPPTSWPIFRAVTPFT